MAPTSADARSVAVSPPTFARHRIRLALARSGHLSPSRDERFGDAFKAFTEAAAMKPGDASLCFGAGVAAFMLGHNEVAQTASSAPLPSIRIICTSARVARGPALSERGA